MDVQAGPVQIHVRTGGEPGRGASPVVFLHGMTLSSEDWGPIMKELEPDWHTIAPDLIGHGRSDAPDRPDPYRIHAVVDQLIQVVDSLGVKRAHWVGYSMGGRILLHVANRHPDRVQSMVLESSTAGMESEADREARRRDDEELAKFLESRSLEAFVDRWMESPVFRSQKSLPEEKLRRGRSIRLRNNPTGLAHCLRELGRGTVPALWDQLPGLHLPTLLVTGEYDEKHVTLHRRMLEALPRARYRVLPEVGHNVHFENPGAFVREVRSFLSGI